MTRSIIGLGVMAGRGKDVSRIGKGMWYLFIGLWVVYLTIYFISWSLSGVRLNL